MTTAFDNMLESALSNPRLLQSQILDEFVARADGDIDVSDHNNTFCFLTETMSRLVAGAVSRIDTRMNALYRKRAQSSEDLFRHMSDYDYAGIYATPARAELLLLFDKDYLMNNAKAVTSNKRRVTIPAETLFVMDEYEFSIYYPINIDINTDTGIITTYWDVTDENLNPLHVLSQGAIRKKVRTYQDINLLMMYVPVYQFERVTTIETVTADVGFVKTYEYDDSFYAVRVYNKAASGEWEEMQQTLSDAVYDPSTPTAYITVMSESNQLRITVPQVYFSNEQIGSQLMIERYTTRGAVDITVGSLQDSTVGYQIPNSDPYAAIFKNITLFQVKMFSTKIVGGSDNSSFEELMSRVVNDSYYSQVPTTTAELENYLEDQGFTASRYRDGVTDRTWLCNKLLTDSNAVPMGCGAIRSRLPILSDASDDLFIVDNGDDSYTLLPGIVYKTGDDGVVDYVSDYTTLIDGLSNNDIADLFNENEYMFSPLFMRIFDTSRFPLAYPYVLSNPVVNELVFIKENKKEDRRVSINSVAMEFACRGFGTYAPGVDDPNGVYTVTLTVDTQGGDETFSLSDVKALVAVQTESGRYIGKLFDADAESSTYTIEIPTLFKITDDDNLWLTEFSGEGVSNTGVTMTSTFSVYFIYDSGAAWNGDEVETSIRELYTYLNGDSSNGTFLNHQDIELELGKRLAEVQYPVRIDYTASEYEMYDTPVYAKYLAPVYETDEVGALVWSATGVADWTFAVGTPVYDLEFNDVDATAIATTSGGSDPADIEPGMAVEASGAIPSLLYVTNVVEAAGTYTLHFNTDPGVAASTISGVAVGEPEAGLVALTEVHAQDDWIFGTTTHTVDVTVDTEGTATIAEADFDILKLYLIEDSDTGLWERNPDRWLCVTGECYPTGAYIESIDEATFEVVVNEGCEILDAAIPVADTADYTCTFGVPQLRHAVGDPDIESELVSRGYVYDVQQLFVNANLLASQEPEHADVLHSINELLSAYTATVASIKPNVLEYTNLFYQPFRTMGTAESSAGEGVTVDVPLDFGVKFKLYVDAVPSLTTEELDNIRDAIETIIDDHADTGEFSCAKVATEIMTSLSDRINNVDVGGLLDRTGTLLPVQSIMPLSVDYRPIMRQELYVDTSNVLRLRRALTLEYVTM
jgi:hypothetical protein